MLLTERLRAHGSRSSHEPTELELEAADMLDSIFALCDGADYLDVGWVSASELRKIITA